MDLQGRPPEPDGNPPRQLDPEVGLIFRPSVVAMPLPPAEPVGPFPPGADPAEYDKTRRRVFWKMPSGLFVLGSRAGAERNGMTLNWATQVSSDPKLVAVAVEGVALTHRLIAEGRVFALSIIDREDRALVRKFVKPAVDDPVARTLNEVPYHDGRSGAPILDQAVAFLDCELRQAVEVGQHTLYIGEVVDAGFQRDEDTPVLRMEDTRMSYGG
jgi:flavin reductase (DIM6/NTAB) family NADH-FMN oxidoreductase RutF